MEGHGGGGHLQLVGDILAAPALGQQLRDPRLGTGQAEEERA